MDESTWIELFRAHMPPLYRRVSRRVGGDRALAEDVTQETWLRAVDAWYREGPARDPDAWLTTVATNLLRNYFRRSRPVQGVDLEDAPAPETGEREAVNADAERAAEIQRALLRLRPDAASLVTEHHLDGLPLAELASRRGLSERAVEGRLHRARRALARHLDEAALRTLGSQP